MTSHQPIILGLTGGIACGKSEVGKILQQAGFEVLDTDSLAHELMTSGGTVFKQVVNRFGESVVGAGGEIDRATLATIVFENPDAREELNRLVHPAVIDAGRAWIVRQNVDAAVMVPLLFEAGWTTGWSAVICVSSPKEAVLQRLKKRGLSEEQARKRIAAQMPLSKKEEKADFIIENNTTLNALREKTMAVLEAVRSRGKDHE